MRESIVEKHLREQVEGKRGLCIKLLPTFFRGIPDRLVLMPNRKIEFVETKATKGRPSRIQLYVHELLKRLGFEVWIINSKEQVDGFIKYMELI